MARTPSLNNDQVRACYEILLSLNLAFAFSYGMTIYNLTQVAYSKGTSDGYSFVYYFLRSAVRINNLLHLRSSNPAYGRLPNPGSQVGVDLAFAISTIGLAVILLLFLRFFLRARSLAAIANHLARFLALFALPGVYLYIFTWRLGTTDDEPYMGHCRSGVSLRWLSIPLVLSLALSLRLGNWFRDCSALLFLAPNTMERGKCNHAPLRSVLAPCLPADLCGIRRRMAALLEEFAANCYSDGAQ
jgi:hypothetical protein